MYICYFIVVFFFSFYMESIFAKDNKSRHKLFKYILVNIAVILYICNKVKNVKLFKFGAVDSIEIENRNASFRFLFM